MRSDQYQELVVYLDGVVSGAVGMSEAQAARTLVVIEDNRDIQHWRPLRVLYARAREKAEPTWQKW